MWIFGSWAKYHKTVRNPPTYKFCIYKFVWIVGLFYLPCACFDLRFIPPSDKMHPVDAKNRYYSTAADKFIDTRMGGSLAINPRAQFCQYSDIRVKNRAHTGEVNINSVLDTGLGRFYSEVFEDNQYEFNIFKIQRFKNYSKRRSCFLCR